MSADRSWSIAPVLAWFGVALVAGLWGLDGDLHALADRLAPPPAADGGDDVGPAAGPRFTARPVVVADADEDEDDDDDEHDAAAAASPSHTGARDHVGALEDVCLEGAPPACKRWGMDGYYRAVAATRRHALGRALRVSWYGDSVIATDAIPGRLRTRLQATLGDGGPGFVFAVAPHQFCHHEQVARSADGDWNTYAISTRPAPDRIHGVGGSTTETHGGDTAYKLDAPVSRVEVYYLAQPHGGSFTLTADRAEALRVETAGERKQLGYATATLTAGATRLALDARGKVRLFGLQLENASGAVVDNFGIVSVNVRHFGYQDPATYGAALAHRGADLVMIMIGANEAGWLHPGDRDTRDYQKRYEQVLAPIRKARPDGACLVVSPTDQAEARNGRFPSRPVMPVLVDAQRRAAHAQGCAFYSTYDWMGGKGSASKWYRRGLVGSDFQHLTRAGANKLADALYDTLMAGYRRYAGP